MTYLRNKKIIVALTVLGVIIAAWLLAKAAYLRIPNLNDFKTQKAYAKKAHNQADERSAAIFFSPNVIVGEFLKWSIGANSWEKSVNAQLYLINKYPDRVKDDVDVYGWLGDSYNKLKQPEEARGAYEKQLSIFKRLYFKKQYPERSHLSDTKA